VLFQAVELTFHRKTLLVSEYSDKIMQRIAFLIMNSIGTAKVIVLLITSFTFIP